MSTLQNPLKVELIDPLFATQSESSEIEDRKKLVSVPININDVNVALERIQAPHVVASSLKRLAPDVPESDIIEDALCDIANFLKECGHSGSEKQLDSSHTSAAAFIEEYASVYPPQHAVSSSAVILNCSSSADLPCANKKRQELSNLEIICSAYTGARRISGAEVSLNCTLIMNHGADAHRFDFEEEVQYWSFIAAVRSVVSVLSMPWNREGKVHGEYYSTNEAKLKRARSTESNARSSYSLMSADSNTMVPFEYIGYCHCILNNAVGGDKVDAQHGSSRTRESANKRGSFLGIFTTTNNKENNKTDEERYPHRWRISNGKLLVFKLRGARDVDSDESAALLVIPIADLSAVTMSVDYESPKPFVLETSLHVNQARTMFQRKLASEAVVSVNISRSAENGTEMNDSQPYSFRGGKCEGKSNSILNPVEIKDLISKQQLEHTLGENVKIEQLMDGSNSTVIEGSQTSINISVYDNSERKHAIGHQSLILTDSFVKPQYQLKPQHTRSSGPFDLSLLIPGSSTMGSLLSGDSPYNSSESPRAFKPEKARSGIFKMFTPSHGGKSSNPSSTAKDAHPHEVNSRTNFSGGGDVNAEQSTPICGEQFLGFRQPLKREIVVHEPTKRKIARLFVKSAADLPCTSGSKPPTAYCTVYMLDANGEKINANSTEARTTAVKSTDPDFNKEFLLDDQFDDDNEVEYSDDGEGTALHSAMLLFRDSAAGFMKHHHIGKVIITIACFLEETEADFCLPLEPTYRMEGDTDQRINLGNVTFTTKLVDFDYGARTSQAREVDDFPSSPPLVASPPLREMNRESATKSATISPLNRGMLSRRNSQHLSASVTSHVNRNSTYLSIILHRVNPRQTKWPVKFLSIENMSSSGLKKQSSMVLTRTASTSAGNISKIPNRSQESSVSDASEFPGHIGFISCGLDAFEIEVEPHSIGIMMSCEEYNATTSTVVISWEKVLDFVALSKSAALVVIVLNIPRRGTTGSTLEESRVKLLVGPCSANALSDCVTERKHLISIRQSLREIIELSAGSRSSFLCRCDDGNVKKMEASASPVKKTPRRAANERSNSTILSPRTLMRIPSSKSPPPRSSEDDFTDTQLLYLLQTACTSLERMILKSEKSVNRLTEHARQSSVDSIRIVNDREELLQVSDYFSVSYTINDGKGLLKTTVFTSALKALHLKNRPRPAALQISGSQSNTEYDTSTMLPSKLISDWSRLIMRAKIYYSYMRFIGQIVFESDQQAGMFARGQKSDESLPEYSHSAVESRIFLDCDETQLFTPLRSNATAETLQLRCDRFIGVATSRIRDYIIYSAANWNKSFPDIAAQDQQLNRQGSLKRQGSNYQATLSRNLTRKNSESNGGHNYSDIAPTSLMPGEQLSGRECVQLLIEGYHAQLRRYVAQYMGSHHTFKKLKALELKTAATKMIIELNFKYFERIQLIIGSSVDLLVNPQLTLCEDVSRILHWYANFVLHDLKKWLIRTLREASISTQSRLNLPWEVHDDQVGVVSFLPELLIQQVQQYLSECTLPAKEAVESHLSQFIAGVEQQSHQHSFHENSDEKIRKLSSYSIDLASEATNMIHHRGAVKLDGLNIRYKLIDLWRLELNDRMLATFAHAFIFYAEEVQVALQAKQWERTQANVGEQLDLTNEHLRFLCATANDCHRVLSLHLTSLQNVEAPEVTHAAVVLELNDVLSYTAEMALRCIIRVVFADVQSILVDFEGQWNSSSDVTIAESLKGAIGKHLPLLRNILQPSCLCKLVGWFAQIVFMRFIIFLKERSEIGSALSSAEVKCFLANTEILKKFFLDISLSDEYDDRETVQGLNNGSYSEKISALVQKFDKNHKQEAKAQSPLKRTLPSLHKVDSLDERQVETTEIKKILTDNTESPLATESDPAINEESICNGVIAGTLLLIDSIKVMDLICCLLSLDFASAAYLQKVQMVVGLFSGYNSTKHLVFPTVASDPNSTPCQYNYVTEALLLGCMANVRPSGEGGDDYVSFIRSILEGYDDTLRQYHRTMQKKRSQFRQKNDPCLRVFAHPTLRSISSLTNYISGQYTSEDISEGVNADNPENSSGCQVINSAVKLGSIFSPAAKAVKQLREKATNYGNVVNKKIHEQYSIQLLVAMGLGSNYQHPRPHLHTAARPNTAARTESVTENKNEGNCDEPILHVFSYTAPDEAEERAHVLFHNNGYPACSSYDSEDSAVGRLESRSGSFLSPPAAKSNSAGPSSIEQKIAVSTSFQLSAQSSLQKGRSVAGLGGKNSSASNNSILDEEETENRSGGVVFTLSEQDTSSSMLSVKSGNRLRILQIGAVQVRGLQSASLSGACNPYIYFEISEEKRIKTPVKHGKNAAQWKELVLELAVTMKELRAGTLTVSVYDKERIRRKRWLGSVSIKLAVLEIRDTEVWYALEGGEMGSVGEVHFSLHMDR